MSLSRVFLAGEYVVYPAHGVGQIIGVETQEISGNALQLYVISFDRDRMTLRLPVTKSNSAGLRSLSSREQMEEALQVLRSRARARRMMWSRRAQEYETKINSGKPSYIAEVVRDLYRNSNQCEQSYSERQIYKEALERLTQEFAMIENIDRQEATTKIEKYLSAA